MCKYMVCWILLVASPSSPNRERVVTDSRTYNLPTTRKSLTLKVERNHSAKKRIFKYCMTRLILQEVIFHIKYARVIVLEQKCLLIIAKNSLLQS